MLNLFFVQCLLQPVNPRAWKQLTARQYGRKFYCKNSEEIKARVKAYRKENLEKVTAYDYRRYHEDAERRADTIARAAESARQHPERNRANKRSSAARPSHRAKKSAYVRMRRAEDPEFKLLGNLRSRIKFALKLNLKASKTVALVGMEIKEYRIYLQGQFRPGMTWENHGTVWHIDHIRPCASFDLSDPAQQHECFNWSNTQPLFAEDNFKKGANGW